MSGTYWLTIEVGASDLTAAERLARRLASGVQGSVIQVDQRPPQGALIVGSTGEDSYE